MEYITYDEFKEEVEKLGFQIVEANNGGIWVETLDGQTVSRIGNERYAIRIYEVDEVDETSLEGIKKLSIRLAITPLDVREDKYYLRTYAIIMRDSAENYLNYCKLDGRYLIANKNDADNYQTIFTKEEIDKLQKEHRVLDSFYMEKADY